MANLAHNAHKQFRNLLDEVAADGGLALHATLGESVGADNKEPDTSALGPSVGDDGSSIAPSVTMLGPSVGDDNTNPSDVRLKDDILRVGTTVFGLPLYQFKYIGASETYEGVMAHEVLQVMPDAVSRGEDGFYRVNYGALGTSMRRVS